MDANHGKSKTKFYDLGLDYYKNVLLSKYVKKQNMIKFNLEKYKIPKYYPYGLLFLNLFNFVDVIKKTIYYSNENFRDIIARLFRINLSSLNENILSLYRLSLNTFKNIFIINFNPIMLLNQSMIYSLGYLNFLRRYYNKNGELDKKDYRDLFFISGLGLIFNTNFLHNFYSQNYIKEIKMKNISNLFNLIKPNEKFVIISIKSILDNFVILSSYFYLINYFSKNYADLNSKTLYQRENYNLFKETINSNDTFKRVEKFYIKDEPIGEKFDISLPIVYTSFILALSYTPIDYIMRFMIENKINLREFAKIILSEENENSINNRKSTFIRFRHLFGINFMTYFLKYGFILNFVQEYSKSFK